MTAEAIAFPFTYGTPPSWATGYGQDEFGFFAELAISTGTNYWEFVTQRFRWIPPGTFMMGSPEDEDRRGSNEVHHRVNLTKGYWLADTTCTQQFWNAIEDSNPSRFQREDNPVERVLFEDIERFLSKLNLKVEGEFSLPTEAQWEYACRAGTETPFSFGEAIGADQVNYNGNDPYADGPKDEYRKQAVPVKELPANKWGLYQMHGNVWEWCSDWYGDYPTAPQSDPTGSDYGSYRVLRGGSWIDNAWNARSAARFALRPDSAHDGWGFRLLSSVHPADQHAERESASRT